MTRAHTPQVAARYSELLKELHDDGRIDVAHTAGRLGVAQETIRRDLRALEMDGKLHRVYGGAVPLDLGSPGASRPPKPAADDVVVKAARRLWSSLPKTGTVAIGPGSSSVALAEVIAGSPPDHPGLTIITTSIEVASVLSRVTANIAIYLIGGTVNHPEGDIEGPWALQDLARFRVDVSVVNPAGIDPTYGVGAATTAAAAVNAAVVNMGGRVIAWAAAEAVGVPAFAQFATISQLDQIMVFGIPDTHNLALLDHHDAPVEVTV